MSMKNVGWRDAGIRAFIAGMLLLWSASLRESPLLAIAAGFVAFGFLGTALYRVCPLYAIFHISTCRGDVPPP